MWKWGDSKIYKYYYFRLPRLSRTLPETTAKISSHRWWTGQREEGGCHHTCLKIISLLRFSGQTQKRLVCFGHPLSTMAEIHQDHQQPPRGRTNIIMTSLWSMNPMYLDLSSLDSVPTPQTQRLRRKEEKTTRRGPTSVLPRSKSFSSFPLVSINF